MAKAECTQCGRKRSIVSWREVCADCSACDRRLHAAQAELEGAAREIMRWVRVRDAAGLQFGRAVDRLEKAVARIDEDFYPRPQMAESEASE